MTKKRGIVELFRERRARGSLYHAAHYWDARAAVTSGLARSVWPSNAYNGVWHERQSRVLERTLGAIGGRSVVDVGCGTGRMSRLFSRAGASEVLGVDFSEATLAIAREETDHEGAANVRFVQDDVMKGLPNVEADRYDIAAVIGILAVACQNGMDLDRAFESIARVVKRGGTVLVLEPIHRSPLLKRVLGLGVEEWVASANRAGLALEKADRMGFAPLRLVLSVRDVPQTVLGPLFSAGEALLDRAPYLAPLSDYKLLLFRRP